MANSKGKNRRVEESDDEDEIPPSTRMDTDGEPSGGERSKKDKGKGRAVSHPASDTNASVKRENKQNGASDHEDDQQDGVEGEAGQGNNVQDGDETIDYEKEQDMDEKRDIRKKYRDLTGNLQEDHLRDPDGMTAASLTERLERANKLFKGVQAPAEAVLDSTFLMLTSDMAMHQARKIKIGSDYFDTEDFLSKLKINITGGIVPPANGRGTPRRSGGRSQRHSDDEDEDYEGTVVDPYVGWDKIGKLATKHTLRIPPIDFMLGPLAIPQKKKVQKKRQAREKNDLSQKIRPQEIGEDDIQQDENSTTTLVRFVATILEAEGGQEGINLFKFLINPDSYTQTVENIFYTSFLVKENKASIDYDDDGQPIIFASLPPDEEQKREGDLKARQFVFEMDMKMWKDAIEAYDITTSVIPTREYQQLQHGKWYG